MRTAEELIRYHQMTAMELGESMGFVLPEGFRLSLDYSLITEDELILLAEKHYNETCFLSGGRRIHDHPTCQIMFRCGERIIPFLLTFLQDKGGWLPIQLLGEIRREVPFCDNDRGKYNVIRHKWLAWGADNKLIEYEKGSRCTECKGKGLVPSQPCKCYLSKGICTHIKACPTCKGSGAVTVSKKGTVD